MIFLDRLHGVGVCLVLCLVQIEGLEDSACYGTNPLCDYYTLDCHDALKIIRLDTLSAGYKKNQLCDNVVSHCNDSSICCSPDNGTDITEMFNVKNTFDTYTNCSGKTFCKDVQAPWQQMTDGTPSKYVFLNYTCETKADKLNFCGGSSGRETSKAAQSVEFMFDGSAETFNASQASKTCQCRISNTNSEARNVTLHITDLRLQTYYRNENQTAECSSANFTSDFLNRLCTDTSDHHNTNFIYDQTYKLTLDGMATSDITLDNIYQNGERDAPAMVWISLKLYATHSSATYISEENGETFSVSCYEVTPALLTSSTATTIKSTTPAPTTQDPDKIVQTTLLDDSESQMRIIYLSVFIPIVAVLIVIIVICICCIYRRKAMKTRSKEPMPIRNTVEEKHPINYIHEVSPTESAVIDGNTYHIPVSDLTASRNDGYTPTQNILNSNTDVKQTIVQEEPSQTYENDIHIRIGTTNSEPNTKLSETGTGYEVSNITKEKPIHIAAAKLSDPKPTNQDASPSQTNLVNVVNIHVDNTSLPIHPSPSKTNKESSMPRASEPSPGVYIPRNSSAVIKHDTVDNRPKSGTAIVLPGRNSDDNSVIFVRM